MGLEVVLEIMFGVIAPERVPKETEQSIGVEVRVRIATLFWR